MAKEEIRCHGRLLAEIDIEARVLYLWCKSRHHVNEVNLDPYVARMLAQESKEQEHKPNIRLVAS